MSKKTEAEIVLEEFTKWGMIFNLDKYSEKEKIETERGVLLFQAQMLYNINENLSVIRDILAKGVVNVKT